MTCESRPQKRARTFSDTKHSEDEGQRVNKHHTTLTGSVNQQLGAPASNLPLELLSKIIAFHFSTTVDIPLPDTNHRYAPLSVCKNWYQAAVSFQSCWTTHSIVWRIDSNSRARDLNNVWADIHLRVRNHWLYAGRQPLNLSIFVRYGGANSASSSTKFGYEFRKYRDWSDILYQIMSLYGGFLKGCERYSEDIDDDRFTAIYEGLHSNHLTRVRLVSVPRGGKPNSVDLPALKYLYIESGLGERKLVMFNCPSLLSLTLAGSFDYFDYFDDGHGDTTVKDLSTILLRFPMLKKLGLSILTIHHQSRAGQLYGIEEFTLCGSPIQLVDEDDEFDDEYMDVRRASLLALANFLEVLPDVKKLILADVELMPLPDSDVPTPQNPSVTPLESEASKFPGMLNRIECIQLEGDVLGHELALESLSQFRKVKVIRLAYYPRHPRTSSVFRQSSSTLDPLEHNPQKTDAASLISEPEFEFHSDHPTVRAEIKLSKCLKSMMCPCCFFHEVYETASTEDKETYDALGVDRLYRYWPLLERLELEGIRFLDSSIGSLVRCLRARETPPEDDDEDEGEEGEEEKDDDDDDSALPRHSTPPVDVSEEKEASSEGEKAKAVKRDFTLSMKDCSISKFFAPTKNTRIPDFASSSSRDAKRILGETLAKLV